MRISETIPEGDIYVESDGILEINCVLYASTADEEMKFISDQHNLSPYVRKKNLLYKTLFYALIL